MLKKYEEHFNQPAPKDVWPLVNKLKGLLPDCCKALCVKFNCTSCVGCDAVDCGYQKLKTRIHLSPSTFGGYVPIDISTLQVSQISPNAKWTKISPFSTMDFSWAIEGQNILFTHSLKTMNAWYAFGISGSEPHGMGEGDFMVSMYSRNYTGVFDLYKYDADGGYPCWDVLYECSVGNTTKGTKDVQNSAIKRENGITTSTWLRKLNTGDSKDWPIVKGDMKVMFAFGKDDWFTQHLGFTMCDLNFYTGKTTCKYDD